MNVYEKLNKIQVELKAPKSQYNNFGKYNYRNLEDILEALKPLLDKHKAVVNISDEIELIGDRYYIKATAMLIDTESGDKITSTGYARESQERKGMDDSQLTGSTSSYARKYAMNGLFAIDDTKDSDYTNKHDTGSNQGNSSGGKDYQITEPQLKRLYAIANSAGIDSETVKEHTKKRFNIDPKELSKQQYDLVCEGYEKMKQ